MLHGTSRGLHHQSNTQASPQNPEARVTAGFFLLACVHGRRRPQGFGTDVAAGFDKAKKKGAGEVRPCQSNAGETAFLGGMAVIHQQRSKTVGEPRLDQARHAGEDAACAVKDVGDLRAKRERALGRDDAFRMLQE